MVEVLGTSDLKTQWEARRFVFVYEQSLIAKACSFRQTEADSILAGQGIFSLVQGLSLPDLTLDRWEN